VFLYNLGLGIKNRRPITRLGGFSRSGGGTCRTHTQCSDFFLPEVAQHLFGWLLLY
jgi:hypothetical protein